MRSLRAFLVLLLISFGSNSFPQASNQRLFKYFEVYGGIGSSHFFGDIGGSSLHKPLLQGPLSPLDNFLDFDPQSSRLSLSLGARYLFDRTFAVSAQIAPIWLSGSDKGSRYNNSIMYRDYSFNAFLTEFHGQGEYYFLRRYTGVNPYVSVGFGGFVGRSRLSRPEQPPLETLVNGLYLSGAFGLRFSKNKLWTSSIELGYRNGFLRKDFIELINSGYGNDCYYLIQYKLSYHLTRGSIYSRKGFVRRSLPAIIKDRWDTFTRMRNELEVRQHGPELTFAERLRVKNHIKRVYGKK
ncbi:MAG: hypothetical protein V2A67_02795 [Bacteroidota bacterium]